MINLLPPKQRLEIRTAKQNSLLRRYLELSIVGVMVLTLLIIGSHYYLSMQERNSKKTVELNQDKIKELQSIEADAEDLSTTLQLIATIISGDVKFSTMLTEIGSLMPPKSVLTGLELTNIDEKTPLLITAAIDQEEKAAILKNNLETSSLFERAYVRRIYTTDSQETTSVTTTNSQNNRDDESKDDTDEYKYLTEIEVYFKPKEKRSKT